MEDQKVIQYYRREIYGSVRFYLVQKSVQAAFSKLTRRKTIEWDDIAALTDLTQNLIRFEEVLPPDGRLDPLASAIRDARVHRP